MRGFLLSCVLLLWLLAGVAANADEPLQAEMRSEVENLVKAAESRTILWPWSGPVPEVAQVASYGKAIAPFLVDLLPDNPEGELSQKFNWNVQQQIALALCKIYGVTEEPGHVYMNRASRKKNASVKRFWLHKVYGELNSQRY